MKIRNIVFLNIEMILLFACNERSEQANIFSPLDCYYVQRFVDSSNFYHKQCALYDVRYAKYWKNSGVVQDKSVYELDSLQLFQIQKLCGIEFGNLCVIVDSCGICSLFYHDGNELCSVSKKELEQVNSFLTLAKNKEKLRLADYTAQLDSLCRCGVNFQIQYAFFESLQDSVRKMRYACELWNMATLLEKKLYTNELLDIFSYMNSYFPSAEEVLYFDSKEIDFGEVAIGTEHVLEVPFKNVGKIAIIILGIETSCGCTFASYPKYPIKPGESAKVKIIFKGRTVGFQRKNLVLKTHGCKSVTLMVKAKVKE